MAEGTHNPGNPEQTQQPQAQRTEQESSKEQVKAAASQGTGAVRRAAAESGLEREGPSLATAALVGVGVAIIDPELIPGLLIGAGAVLAPKILPALGGMVRPLFKGVVKAGYSAGVRVREAAAEVGEQVEDIVAEARSEEHEQHDGGRGEPQTGEPQVGESGQAPRQRRPQRNSPPAANL